MAVAEETIFASLDNDAEFTDGFQDAGEMTITSPDDGAEFIDSLARETMVANCKTDSKLFDSFGILDVAFSKAEDSLEMATSLENVTDLVAEVKIRDAIDRPDVVADTDDAANVIVVADLVASVKSDSVSEMITFKVLGPEFSNRAPTYFAMKKKQSLRKLMKAYCHRVDLDLREAHFSFRGSNVTEKDSPSGLGMSDGDLLEVFARPRDEVSDFINVKVQKLDPNDEKITIFKMKRVSRLGKMMRRYCARTGVELRDARFLYCGLRVRDCDSLSELGMEDGDLIEVYARPPRIIVSKITPRSIG